MMVSDGKSQIGGYSDGNEVYFFGVNAFLASPSYLLVFDLGRGSLSAAISTVLDNTLQRSISMV
jgi:hypothetical protein